MHVRSFIKKLVCLSATALFLSQCQPRHQHFNKFSDDVLLKIGDLQDRRLSDSLYSYFDKKDPLYRADAARAFGSIQDSASIDELGKRLLIDESAAVRFAAAFSIGQIEHPNSAEILMRALETENDPAVIREILYAYGKTTSAWQLKPARFLDDSFKTAGLAWSIYRAGLRNKTDSSVHRLAAVLLAGDYSNQTRLGAAHFFSRGAKHVRGSEQALMAAARNDPSMEVRIAALLSLGKIHSDSSLAFLHAAMSREADARIIVSCVRALGLSPYERVKGYLREAVAHDNVNVAVVASEFILANAGEEDWIALANLATQIRHWRASTNLYQASLKAEGTEILADEIKDLYHRTPDLFQKAAWLTALSEYPEAHEFVAAELSKTELAQVRSAAASALVAMNKSTHFGPHLKLPFLKIYEGLMRSQSDPAVLGIIAMALADSTLEYRSMVRDPSFLYVARKKLRLPEHNESLQSIEAAIAYLENRRQTVAVRNEFNHPINWALVRSIPEDQMATIRTTRGSIVIRLLVNESPGSVANFIELAQKDYFDNKFFHRVVPNFVVQAGCKRGDGWGSEDYSIRSEFTTRRYKTGSVGMASAGKDTEGTQWFITHSSTPHLDGRYTIFAEVVDGMAAVDLIEVGDRILDVHIKDFTAQ